MNLKVFYYYILPHPLEKGKEATVSDSESRAALRNECWEFCRKNPRHRPRIIRYLVSPRKPAEAGSYSSAGSGSSGLSGSLKRNEDLAFSKIKLGICMRFLISLLVGYVLYLAPPSFWQPIETVFDTVAHGLSDYAKWWIILFFPAKGFIRNFGTGIQVPLPRRLKYNPVFRKIPLIGKMKKIGAGGKWQQVKAVSGSTELYRSFDDDLREDFEREIEQCAINILKKYFKKGRRSEENPDAVAVQQLVDRFKSLASEMTGGAGRMTAAGLKAWDDSYTALLEQAAESSRNVGGFPWGELPKLDRLRQELLFFGGSNNFISAPLRVVYPETEPGTVRIAGCSINSEGVIDLNPEIIAASVLKQSRNLRDFFSRDDIVGIRERIYREYSRLSSGETSGNAVKILDSIAGDFAALRDRIGTLHMGANFMIPHEKGKDLPNFYHRLYLIFGRASCDIINGYKRAGWGVRPVRTGAAIRRRINQAVDEALFLADGRKRRAGARIKDRMIAAAGKNIFTGLAAAALIFILIGSGAGLYTLKPDQHAVLNTVRLGYMEQFLNNEITTASFGSGLRLPGGGLELFWHMPPPLTRMQKISLADPSEFTVHMIIGESYTDHAWKKFLQTMSGQLGISYYVAELEFEYVPISPETWKNYDADGKGYRRLVRDTSSIVEEWKTELLSSYDYGITSLEDSAEVNFIFTTYFRELSDKGVIEDYIRRSFSQTAMSTHVYYGSPLERYEPGFLTVIGELESRYEEYGADPFLSRDEKAELQETMQTAKAVVEETLDRIESQVEIEYGDLRRNPDKLMKLVNDPAAHLQELRDFETLWAGIQNYTWYLYNQEKMKNIFEEKLSKKGIYAASEERDYIAELISVLNNDPHISKLIKISSVEYEVIDMGLSRLNLIQQKWRDII